MTHDDHAIGRRIVIYGVTGSGKSTLSRQLGAALGLGVIELDAIRHDGGWDATSWEQMRARAAARLAQHPEGWVCEGNYRRVRDTVLPRADTVVWLRLPWHVTFTRLLLRTLSRAWSDQPLYGPNGPRESFREAFLSRRSILWWAIHHHRASIDSVAAAVADLRSRIPVHVLRSPADVQRLVRAAEAAGERLP